jgi:hypothetical protein
LQYHKAQKVAGTSVFKGLTFALNGKVQGTQTEFKALIAKHMGKVQSVSTLCKYLIVPESKFDKPCKTCVNALGLGIPLIKEEWVFDSINAGKLVEDEQYLFDEEAYDP